MVKYKVEPSALEHRCQCCGEITETVFCEDCQQHMRSDALATKAEDGEPT
ncbi:hypothetical protein M1E17_14665 [Arthrobacter sp. D1-29]